MRRFWNSFNYYAERFASYHIGTYAASASFFIITALFPMVLLVLSIVGFTPLSTQDLLNMIAPILPESFQPLLSEVYVELLPTSATALSLSLLVTLWTASKSMLGLLDGLNAIVDVNDTRNFIFKRIVCMGYMLVLIFGLLVNLTLRVFGEHILGWLEAMAPYVARLFSSAMDQQGLILFLAFTVVFALIYTFFPNKKLRFFQQLPGAVFTSLAWLVFSSLFSIYVNRVGGTSPLYGGLTMAILAMLWLYFCMYIVFIGAVINKGCPELFWRCVVRVRRRFSVSPEIPSQDADARESG